MPNPSTTVTLTGPNNPTSVTLRATAPDTQAPCTVPGVVHRTQGGSLVTYQVGPSYWEATLQIRGLSNAQKTTLEAFFRANLGQSLTYTDENSNTFTAKFLDTMLPLRKGYRDSWDVDLHLNLSSVLI
jgi:hypothetical protein